MSTLEKSPKGLRIAEIILGAIAIALSAAVLANPDVTTLLFVTLLGIALIMIGISRIIVGIQLSRVQICGIFSLSNHSTYQNNV